MGLAAAWLVGVLLCAYAVLLAAGFASLESGDEPIGDPYFALLEIIILLMMPATVVLMIAVHSWAPARLKVLSLASVIFMAMTATLTSALHLAILVLTRHAPFATSETLQRLLSFEWPSLAYVVDILAWDVFFALSMLFASGVFGGSMLALSIRAAMLLSGLLALAGLGGVATGDMALRNVGIAGYVGGFFVVVLLLGVLFHRSIPTERGSTERPGTGAQRPTAE